MSLLQIAEPNQSSNPHNHKYALGIDLGTTHSLVSVVRSGKAEIIPADSTIEDNKDNLLPSVVYFGKNTRNSSPIVGYRALKFQATDAKNTIISAKRFMGRSIRDIKFSHPYTLSGDENSMPAFVTDTGKQTPVSIAAHILQTLYKRAKKALPEESIQGAVITVPAYFDEAQRQATKDAAKLAGINVLRLLNEPTAAAVAYGLDKKDGEQQIKNKSKYHLIYDLGGGTFDVSLLKLNNGVFEVLATGGNSALGGDDIDRLIANWLLKQAGLDPKAIDNKQKSKLIQKSKHYKQQLSEAELVTTGFEIDNYNYSVVLSQSNLIGIIQPVSKRTISICEQVLRDAKITKETLDEVVLVGGSTRMPSIQKVVHAFFEKKPLCNLNPDEVVAIGAAQTANQLISNNDDDKILLLDVTPLSLGLETMGGLVEVIIPRNTPIPVTRQQFFTTYQDGQNAMVIHIVQGERETVDKNRSLGQFILRGIPSMKAGIARIEVTFNVNADGQLTVTAKEANTGIESTIEIVPSYGLSEQQQEQLLTDGFTHAQEDKDTRTIIETKVEAQREILAIESAMKEFIDLLSEIQLNTLTYKKKNLETAIASSNVSVIRNAQAELKPISDEFAALIMNQSVQKTMSGTSTTNWE